MRIWRSIGRGLTAPWRALAAVGRGLAAVGRGLWWMCRWSVRGTGWLMGWRGSGTDRERRLRSWVVQGLVLTTAATCFLIGFGTAQTLYDVPTWLTPFIGAVAGLPFALVVARPLLGLLVSIAGAFVLTVTLSHGDRPWPWLVIHGMVIMALLFAACVRERPARAAGAWLITAALFYWGIDADLRGGWVVGVCAVAVAGLLAGRLALARREIARQEEVSSAEKARRVVLQERARIARDLHDIVAHHMSLVVVQAQTATYRVPGLSPASEAEFASIGESARSALRETRSLLQVLRAEDSAVETAPQPGLLELAALVEGAQRAGVSLTASIEPGLSMPPSEALAVYRITQEALANASRHAAGAPVSLSLSPVDGGVRLRVLTAVTAPSTVAPGGHGITGMRERAAASGGSLIATPTADGFLVEALLPAASEGSA